MSDSNYIYDSRGIAKTFGIDHNIIINDIESIKDLFPDEADQFVGFYSMDYLCPKYYKVTQKGYDLIVDYKSNQFKLKVLEPESNITSEPLKEYAKQYIKKYQPIGGNNTMVYNTISNAPIAKSAPTDEPRCKELVDLWYKKSKASIYIAANAKCGELLEKDSLTQKIIQSLQTIRVLWGTDHPGDDNERQKQYKNGPGYYFEYWMKIYNLLTSNMDNAFWETAYFNYLTCTTATEKLLKGLEEKSKQLLENLYTKHTEILTQITAADTYEQEIQILKAYGVLGTNGIISPAPADEITIPLSSEE